MKSKNKEQSHPSSVGPEVHHQTLQASSSLPPPQRKPLDRPFSKLPQKALHKQAQTSNITNLFNKFRTTIRLKFDYTLARNIHLAKFTYRHQVDIFLNKTIN